MPMREDEPKRRRGVTGLAIPGGLLLGMGIGFLVDDVVAGMFIGLGGGFLLMIALRIATGDW